MKKQLLIECLLCIGFCYGCTTQPKIPEFDCQLLQTNTEYPDSTFFRWPEQLCKQGNNLYIFDRTRGDVAIWDCSTQDTTFQTIGAIGPGPEEVALPKGFYVYKDTVFMADMGALSLKAFYKGRFIRSIPTSWISEQRFFVNDGYAYLTDVTTDTACYAKIPLSLADRIDLQRIQRCGHLFQISSDEYNRSWNQRMLVKGGDYLYAVCMSYPIVEKYELATDNLVESYDLSEIPIVQRIIDNIARENLPPNAVCFYLLDIYWYKNKLYVLCTYSYKGQENIDVIVALDTSEAINPCGIYKLPRKYNSIAIDDEHIYAAGPVTCTIDTYRIPQ